MSTRGIAGDLRFVFGFYAFGHHGGAQRVHGADQAAEQIAARLAGAGNQAAVEFDDVWLSAVRRIMVR